MLNLYTSISEPRWSYQPWPIHYLSILVILDFASQFYRFTRQNTTYISRSLRWHLQLMVAGQATAPGLAVVGVAGVVLWPNTEVATILLLNMVVEDARGLHLTRRPAILTIVQVSN